MENHRFGRASLRSAAQVRVRIDNHRRAVVFHRARHPAEVGRRRQSKSARRQKESPAPRAAPPGRTAAGCFRIAGVLWSWRREKRPTPGSQSVDVGRQPATRRSGEPGHGPGGARMPLRPRRLASRQHAAAGPVPEVCAVWPHEQGHHPASQAEKNRRPVASASRPRMRAGTIWGLNPRRPPGAFSASHLAPFNSQAAGS